MYVIGTAGHVDHGKSTLVKALTGIEPDRLREEKIKKIRMIKINRMSCRCFCTAFFTHFNYEIFGGVFPPKFNYLIASNVF